MDNEVEKIRWQKLLSTKRFSELTGQDKRSETGAQKTDPRSEFEKDYDRIIYSYPFRRLQDKTQVIPFPEFDFVHTRLTHSLEVASVGRSLGTLVGEFLQSRGVIENKNEIGSVVAAAGLAHDIGNPPFGHSGEDAIAEYFNYNEDGLKLLKEKFPSNTDNHASNLQNSKLCSDLNSFEGNAMGFRIVTRDSGLGLNLTSATLATFTKYPRESYLSPALSEILTWRKSQKKHGFFYDQRDEFSIIAEETGLLALNHGFEQDYCWARHPLSFLAEAADDICYSIVDFEDGCHIDLIRFDAENLIKFNGKTLRISGKEALLKLVKNDKGFKVDSLEKLPSEDSQLSYLRAKAINLLVVEAVKVFKENYEKIMTGEFDAALVDVIPNERIRESLEIILALSIEKVYKSAGVLETEAAGFEVLGGLIHKLIGASGNHLDTSGKTKSKYMKKLFSIIPDEYKPQSSDDAYTRCMKIIGYVAGMTDRFAMAMHRRISGISLPDRS